jgi:hypothetical protein
MATEIRAKTPPPSAASVLWLFVAGTYLIAGAYYSFTNAKWPFFMPPQLDVFGWLFGIFGEHMGGYIGVGFLGTLGLLLVALGMAIMVKRDV